MRAKKDSNKPLMLHVYACVVADEAAQAKTLQNLTERDETETEGKW